MEDIKDLYVRRNEGDIVWNRVGQEVIIILTREDKEKVLRLNKTAGFIWENCNGTEKVQDIIRNLCLKYAVNEPKATDEAVTLLNQMKKMQLISLSTDPS